MLSDADADGESDELRQGAEDVNRALKIKIHVMARSVTGDNVPSLRRSTRNHRSSDSFAQPSGSEYSAPTTSPSDAGSDSRKNRKRRPIEYVDDDEAFDTKPTEEVEYTTSHGRKTTKRATYFESDEDTTGIDLFKDDVDVTVATHSRSTRSNTNGNARRGGKTIVSDEEDGEAQVKRYATRNQTKKLSESASPPIDIGANDGEEIDDNGPRRITRSSSRRITRKSQRQLEDEDGYEAPPDGDAPGSS